MLLVKCRSRLPVEKLASATHIQQGIVSAIVNSSVSSLAVRLKVHRVTGWRQLAHDLVKPRVSGYDFRVQGECGNGYPNKHSNWIPIFEHGRENPKTRPTQSNGSQIGVISRRVA